MINEHFTHVMGGGTITSPLIWECTRFCLRRQAPAQVAAALMLAGGEILSGLGIMQFVGVFDARMVRIYRMIGASPEVLGSDGEGRNQISVGLWAFTDDAKAAVSKKSGISAAQSRAWFEAAFGMETKAMPLLACA
jgi:acyl homoserine lactone synthase